MSSLSDHLAVQQRLGDFEIVREIGRGGMGVVFEARQLSLNRRVALKVLAGGLGLTPHAVQRFHREAEAAAKLHHTNIVPIYATGEQDGTHFYAMELIEGPSLNHVIRQLRQASRTESAGAGPAPPEPGSGPGAPSGASLTGPYVEGLATSSASAGGSSTQLSSDGHYFDTVARLTAAVADALEHAHRHGVIHRDIKPSNLLLAPEGRLSINDFGLARVLEQPGVTMTGEFVGTPAYMSPEQITAGRTPLDHRTDIYSLGATLYELLTLRPPFAGERRDQVLAQILHKEPVPPRKLNPKVPVDLETICLKALEKDPDRRYPTAKAMADDLHRYLDRFAIAAKRAGPAARLAKLVRRNKLATAALALILLLAAAAWLSTWFYLRARDEANRREQIAELERQKNRAHDQVPIIAAHIKAQRYREALDLLQKVELVLPEDPRLQELRMECSWVLTILTDPPGATVARKAADGGDDSWEQLGPTPIQDRRLARGDYHWKFEMPGYAMVEGLAWDGFLNHEDTRGGGTFVVKLEPEGTQPPDMVAVQARGRQARILFFVDRYEVTNRQYKQFVDLGGYRKKEFWEHPFQEGGKALTWEQAMARFRDTTGRPGPATWVLGSYPAGQDDYPVGGVSWYEAAAYAQFAGKSLPPVSYWQMAAGLRQAPQIVPRSNLEGAGPARVGQFRGLGPFGTYDMAGNVKEWCWNSAGDGKRFILGGAWDEKSYMFVDTDARSAFDRDRTLGFRCVKYLPGQEPSAQTLAESKRLRRDFFAQKPLTDREFELVKVQYDYDKKRPLKAKLVREEETTLWVHERVEMDAAYGMERLTVHLFIPKEARPPYQSVIHWPGAGARQARTIASPFGEGLAFLVQSGRVLVWPIYKGTYERRPQPSDAAASPWELWIQQANDLRRAIDYLQTRKDLDAGAIGYYGVSWGAAGALLAVALEDRIKAAVLIDGGLWFDPAPRPERDPVHYIARIKIPVLMLNGEYDNIFPPEESQKPLFQLLGTDPSRKDRKVFKSSHVATPMAERIQETVSWFDRYLGPVNRTADTGVAPD